ncbi:MAG: hypothetical protein HOQ03_11645 [Thermoleophilia bacterium]|nr:hypothetical protein [Thermoleophilia bacterium]
MNDFNSPDRRSSLLEEWGLSGHELFREELTLDRVRAAVAEEQAPDGPSVDVAWWIWFFGGPPKKPDWVWGVDDETEDDDDANGGGGLLDDDEDDDGGSSS